MSALRWTLAALLVAAGSACAVKINRVTMDTARLEGAVPGRLACAYRLGEVVDARPAGGNVGGMGKHVFTLDDPTGAVRSQLIASGFSDAADVEPTVGIRIMRLYMEGSHVSKIPVAVYAVTVGTQPAFLVRSQKTSIVWYGSEKEAYRGYTEALRDANRLLIDRLNAACR